VHLAYLRAGSRRFTTLVSVTWTWDNHVSFSRDTSKRIRETVLKKLPGFLRSSNRDQHLTRCDFQIVFGLFTLRLALKVKTDISLYDVNVAELRREASARLCRTDVQTFQTNA